MARRGQECRREGDGEHRTRLPTIAFALAAMEGSLVGASTERLRAAPVALGNFPVELALALRRIYLAAGQRHGLEDLLLAKRRLPV